MKYLFVFTMISLIMFTSCDETEKKTFDTKQGYVTLNQFKNDSIQFTNTCSNVTDKGTIESLILETCYNGRRVCKNKLTFKPKSAIIYNNSDTIVVSLDFEASNAYGVPGALSVYCKFKGNSFVALEDETVITEK